MDYGDYNKEHSEKTLRNYANTEVKILSSVLNIHILMLQVYLCALQLRNVEQILINNMLRTPPSNILYATLLLIYNKMLK